MTIERDLKVDFDEARLAGIEGSSMARVLARPGGREDWKGALADARALVEPAAVWDFFPAAEIGHQGIVLSGGARLGGGPVAEVVAEAVEVAVSVCSSPDGRAGATAISALSGSAAHTVACAKSPRRKVGDD